MVASIHHDSIAIHSLSIYQLLNGYRSTCGIGYARNYLKWWAIQIAIRIAI